MEMFLKRSNGMSGVAILYVEIYVLYIEIFMDYKIYLWTKNIFMD